MAGHTEVQARRHQGRQYVAARTAAGAFKCMKSVKVIMMLTIDLVAPTIDLVAPTIRHGCGVAARNNDATGWAGCRARGLACQGILPTRAG